MLLVEITLRNTGIGHLWKELCKDFLCTIHPLCVCVCVCERERESVAQSHQTFCNPMVARFLSMEFSRQEFWSELPFPSPGDLPNSEIEPRSPTLQADSLPAKPPGNPICPFCIIVNVLPVACLICSNDYLEFMFLDT